MKNITASLSLAPSDSVLKLGDTEIEGVRRVEVISQAGAPTKMMIMVEPTQIAINTSVYQVISETGILLAKHIAAELGMEGFEEQIYDAIQSFGGTNA